MTGPFDFAPALRNWLRCVMCIKGCQPRATISWNSPRAYSPRSVITITFQPGGTRPENERSNAIHSGFLACATLACRTFQVTGKALPRSMMPIDRTVKRSPRLVASRAKANRVEGQPRSVQANRGAEQVVTSSWSRLVPDLAAAG
jgi:hypothetical protein